MRVFSACEVGRVERIKEVGIEWIDAKIGRTKEKMVEAEEF